MIVHGVGSALGHVGGLEVSQLLQQKSAELGREDRQREHPARQTAEPRRQLTGRDVTGPRQLHQLQQSRLQTVRLTKEGSPYPDQIVIYPNSCIYR